MGWELAGSGRRWERWERAAHRSGCPRRCRRVGKGLDMASRPGWGYPSASRGGSAWSKTGAELRSSQTRFSNHSRTLCESLFVPCLALRVCRGSRAPGSTPRAPPPLRPEATGMARAAFSGTESPGAGFPSSPLHSSAANRNRQLPKTSAENRHRSSTGMSSPSSARGEMHSPPQHPSETLHRRRPALFFMLHNKNTKRQIPADKGGKMGRANTHRKQTHF